MLTQKRMWDREGVDHVDSYSNKVLQHRFMASQTVEAITDEKQLLLQNTTALDVSDEISKLLGNVNITGEAGTSYVISGILGAHEVLVFIGRGARSRDVPTSVFDDEDLAEQKINRISIEVTAHRDAIKQLFSHLSSKFDEVKVGSIKWWFKGNHGAENKELFLGPLTTTLHPEFYPYMDNPKFYLKEYMNSDASILLLSGPSGTGKTTILRHLICDFNLSADIIYDENLMNNDEVFQNFLFGKSQIMLIEDADSILQSREVTNNPLMARFLNVSEGIVKLPDKKLVFTTNISDFNKVDSALKRPGRCFDVVHTRELTYKEACIAAEVAGIGIPSDEKDYTLAELLRNKSNLTTRKPGFR